MYMDEDILDSLMLFYIGQKWSVDVKAEMYTFFHSPAWQKPMAKLSETERKNRQTFLNENKVPQLLHNKRTEQFVERYFMSQLPDEMSDLNAYDVNDSGPMDIKQSLLHKIITESLIADKLHGDFAVIRSDFSWFGPSLPFDTIFTVLRFFGVPDKWLDLFERFLRMPMQWGDEVRERKRGVPIDHVLSDFFGEVVLFCMDFAVNQATGGYLYRLHDDFWYWGSRSSCERAWGAMNKFASVMGLQFNEEKTGSVVLSGDKNGAAAAALPQGAVKWGFLQLDADTKQFKIVPEQVDEHVQELYRQLSACTSIFGWVRAWNSYFARFFTTNFGKPANCFGQQHIDMVIDTYTDIEKALFAKIDASGAVTNVTDYLMRQVAAKTDDCNFPPALLYLPIEYGGLGLKNPYVTLFAMRDATKKSPARVVQKALDDDEVQYERLKVQFYNGGVAPSSSQQSKPKRRMLAVAEAAPSQPTVLASGPGSGARDGTDDNDIEPGTEGGEEEEEEGHDDGDDDFMSLEEFTRYREATSLALFWAYDKLMEMPEPVVIGPLAEITSEIDDWQDVTKYDKWVFHMYGPQVKRAFGSIKTVEDSSIPMGIIDLLQTGKMKWKS